ncbi:hypothetical protein [Streptomyces sp. NPDC058092]|uniref:restriction endonuclease-related protein n=1 Tax=Streptomyces sp. NPDC058092 TaxID=3346336 RepID=UPI0036ECC88A
MQESFPRPRYRLRSLKQGSQPPAPGTTRRIHRGSDPPAHARPGPERRRCLVRLEEYPGLDAGNGAVWFHQPGSDPAECWLFDAKDCVGATLLGRRFTCDRRLRAARRFLVVAQHRATPAYFADVGRDLDGRISGVGVVDEEAGGERTCGEPLLPGLIGVERRPRTPVRRPRTPRRPAPAGPRPPSRRPASHGIPRHRRPAARSR